MICLHNVCLQQGNDFMNFCHAFMNFFMPFVKSEVSNIPVKGRFRLLAQARYLFQWHTALQYTLGSSVSPRNCIEQQNCPAILICIHLRWFEIIPFSLLPNINT